MFFAWVTIGLYLLQEHQIVIPILLLSYSISDYSFPGQFFFFYSFESQGSYIYGCSFVKSDKYSSSEVSFSSEKAATMVDRQLKNLKLHWLKRLKTIPKRNVWTKKLMVQDFLFGVFLLVLGFLAEVFKAHKN